MTSKPLILDVRNIPFWRRLESILAALDRLAEGGGLELVADLDPWPLRSYLEATRGGNLTWTYLESGPQVWRVLVERRGA
ncbi:MAG: DUF2249 domain-containing protein [Aquincola sp.]|nr:DUF2249 domain-containing protein [Aquincola sp.]MDH5330546.1 DUF2249 domain-containing protein [Aquincola sp.]